MRNKKVVVIIDKIQDQIILQKARDLGYTSKSAFARDRLLSDNFTVEEIINKIYEVVCKKCGD